MSKKKLLAMLTGMVMAFMGLAGVGAATANNANEPEMPQAGTSRAPIPDKASLTVHKYLGATTKVKNNGTAITDGSLTGKTALKGVKFNLYKVVGVDISKNDDLKVAREISEHAITVNEAKTEITVNSKTYSITPATPASAVTDKDGTAKFGSKNRGLYVVVEDLAGSGTITGGGKEVKKEKITPIAPFAVTLPMTNPDGKGWNSDVHVYPKNQKNELDKVVKDDGVAQGKDFTYTLSTTSTGADTDGNGTINGADLGGVYEIVDPLNSNLTYVSATVKIGGTTAKENTEYTLTKPTNENNNTVTIAFKDGGLDKIAAGTTVEVVLTVTLKDIPNDGIIKNKARLYPNSWSKNEGKGTPIESPEVETRRGDIVIKKVNSAGKTLDGAVFSVHLDTSANKDCSSYGETIKTSGETGTNGLVSIKGLQLTNFIDGKDVPEQNQVPYCLVEEKAPAGYQILPKAIPFKLTKAGTADLTTAIEGDGSLVKITNHENPGLPLTGAQGILLVSALGLILVSIGVVLTVKRRKD